MTDWQDKQNAILDRIEERINALPKRIANDLRYGLYRECRSLVGMLYGPKNSGSAHDSVEKMIRELDADMELLHACVTARPTVPDTVQAPDVAALPPEVVAVLEAAQRLMVEWHGKPLSSGPRALGEAVRALLATGTTPAVSS